MIALPEGSLSFPKKKKKTSGKPLLLVMKQNFIFLGQMDEIKFEEKKG